MTDEQLTAFEKAGREVRMSLGYAPDLSGRAIERLPEYRPIEIRSEYEEANRKATMYEMAAGLVPPFAMRLAISQQEQAMLGLANVEYGQHQRSTAVAVAEEPTTSLLGASDLSDREFLSDYQKLAAKIGYKCAESTQKLAEADLLDFLHENQMPVYDYDAVKRYLDATVEKMNAGRSAWGRTHAWRWMPLRESDREFDIHDGPAPAAYTKPIPYPVLCTVEKVVERFDDRVQLLVSDIYTVAKADPFLAAHVPGSKRLFVIERWDEPKFRG